MYHLSFCLFEMRRERKGKEAQHDQAFLCGETLPMMMMMMDDDDVI